MYKDTDDVESVKDENEETEKHGSGWHKIYAIVEDADKHLCLREFVSGVWAGGSRDGEKPLGRASVASPEEQAKNAKKRRNRNRRDFQSIVNKNESLWTSFDTFSYAGIERNPDAVLRDWDIFVKEVNRQVQTHLTPSYTLQHATSYSFQDGKRRKDKTGRFALHLHSLNTLPFWQCYVICEGKEGGRRYLLRDGSFSKVATRETVFFDGGNTNEKDRKALNAAQAYLEAHRKTLVTAGGVKLRVQKLPMYSILWGKGQMFRRWFKTHMEENAFDEEKGTYDAGAYVAGGYMLGELQIEQLKASLGAEETARIVERFKGKKGYLHTQFRTNEDGEEVNSSGIERPGKFHDGQGRAFLDRKNAWNCLTSVSCVNLDKDAIEAGEEDFFERGWMIEYRFNLWALEKSGITTLPLNDRSVLNLPPELQDSMTEYDLEVERRRKEALSPPVNVEPVKPPGQLSLCDDWTRPGHFWG